MKCKNIQDLILTDYLDNEMDLQNKKKIEAHLSECQECLQYASFVQKNTVEPFNEAQRHYPPQSVWQNIKKAIEEGQKENEFVLTEPQNYWKKMRNFFPLPQQIFALGGVLAVLVMVVLINNYAVKKGAMVQRDEQNQVEYLASLAGDFSEVSLDEKGDYGTVLEQYFL